MKKQNTHLNKSLEQQLDKSGRDVQQGIKWLLAFINLDKSDDETLLNLCHQLSDRLPMFESNLKEYQAQLELEQSEK